MDGLAVFDEVAPEVVEDRRHAIEHLPARRAIEQQLLGAEHLGDLGQDRGAAGVHAPVRDSPDERIGRDAAQAVGASALESELEVGQRTRLASIRAGHCDEFGNRGETRLQLILHALRRERADPAPFDSVERPEQPVQLVRLATETDDEDAPRIRMARQRRDQAARARKVVAKLRTAERMRERMHAVDDVRVTLRCNAGDALRGSRHATDGAQDPDFIAGPDASVAPPVTHEGPAVALPPVQPGREAGRKACVASPASRVLQIVRVHPGARVDRSVVEAPIGHPYLRTSAPCAIVRSATLCPAGMSSSTSRVASPTRARWPRTRPTGATATSSSGSRRNTRGRALESSWRIRYPADCSGGPSFPQGSIGRKPVSY